MRFLKALFAVAALLAAAPAFAQTLGAPNSTATSMATQTADHVAIIGGTIDGVTIGANTPVSIGALCTVTGASPQTCNGQSGIVTTGTLTTAAATAASYTINDSSVTSSSLISCTNQGYSGTYVTNGYPTILDCKAGTGTITVDFVNTHASNALNGTLKFGFAVLH